MSVTRVTLIDEFSGTKGNEGSDGTRVYQVLCDSLNDDTDTALFADDGTTAVPAVGDAWKAGSPKKVIGKDAKRVKEDSQFLYEVTVAYSSSASAQSSAANPLNAEVRVSRRSGNAREKYFVDVDENRVTNSAGDAFAELPERDVAELWQFVVTKNVSSATATNYQTYINSLNAGSITVGGDSISAGKAKLDSVEISEKQTAQINESTSVDYYVRTVTITARPSWDDKFEDRGLRDVDRLPKQNADGSPITDPWPLDGAGAFKASAASAPAQIIRKPYARKSWPSSLYS